MGLSEVGVIHAKSGIYGMGQNDGPKHHHHSPFFRILSENL